MNGFKDLKVYRLAFENAMEIYTISKKFPIEERFSLTDQIRRSSRSVCANIAEAFRNRKYPNSFIHKLTIADAECSETLVWLEFAVRCKITNEVDFDHLSEKTEEIGRLLGAMIQHPEKFH